MTDDETDTGMGVSSERTTGSTGLGVPKPAEVPAEEAKHPKGAGRLHGYPKRRNHG